MWNPTELVRGRTWLEKPSVFPIRTRDCISLISVRKFSINTSSSDDYDWVSFRKIGFTENSEPSQVASSEVIKKELDSNSKELLIVAPPGSGKTVLGLYVWSDLVRLPTLF